MFNFPVIDIEGVKVPKFLIGINSLLGWSHTSAGRDEWIKKYFTVDKIAGVFAHCIRLGLYGVLGPVYPKLHDAIKMAEDMTGQGMLFVSTTFGDVNTTAQQVKTLKDFGSPICCIHGGWADGWQVRDGKLEGFENLLSIIRDAGLIPGSACHNAKILKILNDNNYDCAVFVTPVNKMGFYMNPSKEFALEVIGNCSKPIIAIKPLASGRFEEGKVKDWLKWVMDTKGVFAMVIGFMSEEEATEDINAIREIIPLME